MLKEYNIKIDDLNVLIILDKLNDANYSAYLIGGAVRDILMGNKPHDYDIATDATPEEVMKVFKDTIYDIIPTGIDFGTVTLRHTFDKKDYQVTTFRSDGKYIEDGRKPEAVTYSNSLLEDVKRRDFTINSIAYSELTGIVDVCDGQSDINRGIIRTVGEPSERFYEDPLRILRAIRFAFRYNFTIESDTLKAMLNLAGQEDNTNSVLNRVSKERIQSELVEILSYTIKDRALYDSVWPILNNVLKIYKGDRLACSDIFKECNDYALKLGYLYSTTNYDLYQIEQKLRELKFTNNDIKDILNYVKAILYAQSYVESNGLITDEGKLTVFLKKITLITGVNTLMKSIDYITSIILDSNSNVDINKVCNRVYSEPRLLSDLAIGGTELASKGYVGRDIGRKLNELLELVIENPSLNTRDQLLSII